MAVFFAIGGYWDTDGNLGYSNISGAEKGASLLDIEIANGCGGRAGSVKNAGWKRCELFWHIFL